jgi:hypothetical protein
MREMRNEYSILVELEKKRPVGRHGCRWEDNIRMDLREVGWGGVWTGCVWLRIGSSIGPL